MIRRIGIVGAGAWGTALAVIAQRAGREVILWARRPDQAAVLTAERENRLHLPGVRLAPAIGVTAALEEAIESEAVLIALPAQHLREHLRRFQGIFGLFIPRAGRLHGLLADNHHVPGFRLDHDD